jgi:KDO2-lipid IV(A) lauroyltransferase
VYNARLLRHKAESALAHAILGFLGRVPRPLGRCLAAFTAILIQWLVPRYRRVAHRNLRLAMPQLTAAERRRLVRGIYLNLGRMLAEFAHFPDYTRENVSRTVTYDGFENYAEAVGRGRGVLFLTAHLSAWELGAFAHSIYGYPLSVVIRALDNPLINELVNRYRMLGGNRIIEKRDFLRGILEALKNNETVGILMDQNASPQEGVFVEFFGRPACTSAGMAKIALRTDAAVVPAFTIWDADRKRYRIRFDPPLELIRTGDNGADVTANTQLFTSVLEKYIRSYPDQWLWIHRRWKTRPPGEPPLY